LEKFKKGLLTFFHTYFYEALFVLIAIIAIVLQHNYLHLYPRSLHAWAQSDLYALAKGYLNNGFDLLHPEGYVYNKQFPYYWNYPYDSTITGGNLPLHQYFIALLMALFNNDGPFIFRTYVLIFSLIGFYYLLQLAKLYKINAAATIFLVSIALFSPIYFYYQASFLIVIPCIATTFMGLYYYFLHLKINQIKHWNIAVVILFLTLIVRTTYAIPLIAMLLHQLLIGFQTKKFQFKKIIVVGLMGLVWGAITMHIHQLSAQHGSYFLAQILPAENWQQFLKLLSEAINFWNWNYFSPNQVGVFVVLFTISLFFLRKKHVTNLKGMGYFVAILGIGYCMFIYAMISQFHDHDYYFLDTAYIFFILLMVASFSLIKHTNKTIQIIAVLTALLFINIFKNGTKQAVEGRYFNIHPKDIVSRTSIDYENSVAFINNLKIEASQKIGVLGFEASQLPFLFIGKKGYAINCEDEQSFNKMINWGIDYVFCSNSELQQKVQNHSFVQSRLQLIATNGKISYFKVIH